METGRFLAISLTGSGSSSRASLVVSILSLIVIILRIENVVLLLFEIEGVRFSISPHRPVGIAGIFIFFIHIIENNG